VFLSRPARSRKRNFARRRVKTQDVKILRNPKFLQKQDKKNQNLATITMQEYSDTFDKISDFKIKALEQEKSHNKFCVFLAFRTFLRMRSARTRKFEKIQRFHLTTPQ